MKLKCLVLGMFLMCLTNHGMAQPLDTAFRKQWIEIDSLIGVSNLTNSALNKVNELFLLANKRNEPVHQIKALLYRNTLEAKVTESDINHKIAALKAFIESTSDIPSQSLIHLFIANLLQDYFNSNRWKLYERSKISEQKSEDILSWGADDFLHAIENEYQLALIHAEDLKKIRLDKYESLILKGNAPTLRPTLFDLIAHDALSYFKKELESRTRPQHEFSIHDAATLADYKTFSILQLTTTDSNAHAFRTLVLYQQLIRFHINDENKDALIHVDLDRINWVAAQSTIENKKMLKEHALQSIIQNFPTSATVFAYLQLVKDKIALAQTYQANIDSTHRYQYKEAIQMIATASAKFGRSNPAANELENIRQSILAKNLNIVSENVTIPNQPFRCLVKYKNVDTVYYRILSVPLEAINYRQSQEAIIQSLCTTKAYAENKQWLPITGDYQEHAVEIKIDALPIGEYVLLSSSGKGFDPNKDYFNYHTIQVSNLSFIQNDHDLFVLNRETGMPIKNAEVDIFSNTYYADQLLWNNDGKKKTDENGHIVFEGNTKDKVFKFTIRYENDVLRILGPSYMLDYSTAAFDVKNFERNNRIAYFFTDRSIYRPGQTVFFKTIVSTIDVNSHQHKLINNEKMQVQLYDVNRRLIDSLILTSNEYGSITGKFVLPEKLLTGNFSIQMGNGIQGNTNISVEAYKRPTFTVQFEKVKKAYRINDTITVKGSAKALAGYPLNSASVNYRIVRNARPLYAFSGYFNFRYSAPQEIAQGTVRTDEQGNFSIPFKASPDQSKENKKETLFEFSIEVTITEKSGETRTARTALNCGYQSILLDVKHSEIVNANNAIKIGVSSTNYNYEKEPALVQLKLESLKAPDRILRERYWQRPDQFIMSREESIQFFPNDIYNNENEIDQYPIEKIVFESMVDTKVQQDVIIDKDQLKSGYYQITATTKDSLGNEVVYKNWLQVFNTKEGSIASNKINFYFTNNEPIEPGMQDTIYAGTNTKDLYVIQLTQRQNKSQNYQFMHRKKGLTTSINKIEESDRGGMQIEELIVFQNRVYINRINKIIPFTNKDLNIRYTSFRNKTEPGSTEKWTVDITGYKAEKTAAELVTGMYDASLDAIKSHNWSQPNWFSGQNFHTNWNNSTNLGLSYARQYFHDTHNYRRDPEIKYDEIASNFVDLWNVSYQNHVKHHETPFTNPKFNYFFDSQIMYEGGALNETVVVGYNAAKRKDLTGSVTMLAAPPPTSAEITVAEISNPQVEPIIRKNFNETAFFFPQLYADSTGKFSFGFTMPDAINKWKWMSFAHTKDLSSGMQTEEIQTQKTLMLQSNAPRFMREGDKMEFSTRIANMSDKELTGQVTLELIDATTNTSVDGWFQNVFPTQYFTVAAKQMESVKFPIQIPFSYNKPLIWRVVARSGNFSDGEENVLAVLSNRSLVTETLPLLVKGDTTQQFQFNKLAHPNSSSLSNESLTVEFSSNPIWYAVQALPYLKQGLDNCSEAIFNTIYANTIAAYIVSKHPIIKTWFYEVKKDSTALLSNLQKNQQLKQTLLEATPWVLAANTEAERKKNLSELFNLIKLSESNQSALEKLQDMQLFNGAFSWFKGGSEDAYITTYILTGFGRLKRLGAITPDMAIRFKPMLLKAIQYCDEAINKEYAWLLKHSSHLELQNVAEHHIQYLYMRSFYNDIAKKSTAAADYYTKQSKVFWGRFSVYDQSLIGLIQIRNKEEKFVGKTLLPSIFENAVVDKQTGMYWKQNNYWDWFSSPVETGSMVVELATEYNRQVPTPSIPSSIDAIKTWLILNKQTNNWKTSIKTANACYALLLNGSDWLQQQKTVEISLGKTIINSADEKTEAGTGYFEKRIEAAKIDSSMGEIKLTTKTVSSNATKSKQPAWGAVYWQYFEDLDKITEAKSPLSIQKELMVEKTTDKGKELVSMDANHPFKVGDKLIVRMIIKTDREMEYVHLKDMRAAGMEPVNVLSGYKWQDRMGYYESTTDISSNFFISKLGKGTYVFEYPVYLTHTGNFSVGIATIQCMYAPEFNSHSEGIRINVEE